MAAGGIWDNANRIVIDTVGFRISFPFVPISFFGGMTTDIDVVD
jgi:hypothetical protein